MIEPKVTFAQVLKVPATRVTVGSMQQDHQTKAGFAERLNELVAEQGEIPEKFKGLQGALARRFGVTQKAARKWLEGGIPGHRAGFFLCGRNGIVRFDPQESYFRFLRSCHFRFYTAIIA